MAQEWLNKDYAPAASSNNPKGENTNKTANDGKTANTGEKTEVKTQTQNDNDSVKTTVQTPDTQKIKKAQNSAWAIAGELKALKQSDAAVRRGVASARLLNSAEGRDNLVNILNKFNKIKQTIKDLKSRIIKSHH